MQRENKHDKLEDMSVCCYIHQYKINKMLQYNEMGLGFDIIKQRGNNGSIICLMM